MNELSDRIRDLIGTPPETGLEQTWQDIAHDLIAALERAERLEAVLRVISAHPQAPSAVVGIARAALAAVPPEEDK